MNKYLKFFQLANALLLVRFSLSKLLAWPISVEAFIEMSGPLGIDPAIFRLFTGVIITAICLGYFFCFYTFLAKKVASSMKYIKVSIFFNFLGLFTMTGALGAEFFLRLTPKWLLVVIASFIITNSLYSDPGLNFQ